VEVRRYQNVLYAMSALPEIPQTAIIDWNPAQTLYLPLGQLKAISVEQSRFPTLSTGLAIQGQIQVRFRRGGETLYLRGHSRSVKKLLQQSQIPPWLRSFIPLIYMDDQLVAIPQLGIDERFQAIAGQKAYVFEWLIALGVQSN
jgi:tRNA(Ile)-lysidine synthase